MQALRNSDERKRVKTMLNPFHSNFQMK